MEGRFFPKALGMGMITCFVMVGFCFGVDGDMGLATEPLTDGSETYPYLIEDFTDFETFAGDSTYWAAGVHTQMECDIDLDPCLPGRHVYSAAVIAPDTDNSTRAYVGTTFKGSFNGDGHVIRNLTIDTGGIGNHFLGLFGAIDDPCAAIIKISMTECVIKNGPSSLGAGALCGFLYDGTIDCSNIDVTIHSDYYGSCIGGIAGVNNDGNIANSHAMVSISSDTTSVGTGGICGSNGGNITRCCAKGTISYRDNSSLVGGLSGDSSGTIINSYAMVSITGYDSSSNLGGFCGRNRGFISGCYATGDIDSERRVEGAYGGFVATNESDGTIQDSYSTGSVLGYIGDNMDINYLGGFCARNQGNIHNCYSTGSVIGYCLWGSGFCSLGGGEISNCFWDVCTSGQDRSDGGQGKTTAEMKAMATFSSCGWDFNPYDDNVAIWYMRPNDYPKHYWQSKLTYSRPVEINLDKDSVGTVEFDVYTPIADGEIDWELYGYESCSWITYVTPIIGTTSSPIEKTKVTVSIDSTGLAIGNYRRNLILDTTDDAQTSIPLLLHVYNHVDLEEFALLSQHWLTYGCAEDQPCAEADFYTNNVIDMYDLIYLQYSWLEDNLTVFKNGIYDSFETGGFSSSYNWSFYPSGDWLVTDDTAFHGYYSARTLDIKDNDELCLSLSFWQHLDGYVSFAVKTSSEKDADYLKFYIDGVLYGQWSGEQDWVKVKYPITNDFPLLQWKYSKDNHITCGQDCAWIDDIYVGIDSPFLQND